MSEFDHNHFGGGEGWNSSLLNPDRRPDRFQTGVSELRQGFGNLAFTAALPVARLIEAAQDPTPSVCDLVDPTRPDVWGPYMAQCGISAQVFNPPEPRDLMTTLCCVTPVFGLVALGTLMYRRRRKNTEVLYSGDMEKVIQYTEEHPSLNRRMRRHHPDWSREVEEAGVKIGVVKYKQKHPGQFGSAKPVRNKRGQGRHGSSAPTIIDQESETPSFLQRNRDKR